MNKEYALHQIDFFYKGYDYASSKIYRVLHFVRSTWSRVCPTFLLYRPQTNLYTTYEMVLTFYLFILFVRICWLHNEWFW